MVDLVEPISKEVADELKYQTTNTANEVVEECKDESLIGFGLYNSCTVVHSQQSADEMPGIAKIETVLSTPLEKRHILKMMQE